MLWVEEIRDGKKRSEVLEEQLLRALIEWEMMVQIWRASTRRGTISFDALWNQKRRSWVPV